MTPSSPKPSSQTTNQTPRVTIFARETWDAFFDNVNNLGIHHLPWLNKWRFVELNPNTDNDPNADDWILRPEAFVFHLQKKANDLFPMGDPDYPRLGLDWEKWNIHSAKRITQMQDLLITATNFFSHEVQIMFYGLPIHRHMWIEGSKLDWLYQTIIDMQGAIWLGLYNRGTEPGSFRQDIEAATRLLGHARNISKGKPIVASVSGRTTRNRGWVKLTNTELKMYFAHLFEEGCNELNIFGDLSFLQDTRNRSGPGNKWPLINPKDIPTDEEYAIELANVLSIAHNEAINA